MKQRYIILIKRNGSYERYGEVRGIKDAKKIKEDYEKSGSQVVIVKTL